MVAFTYLLRHKPSGKLYYGVRCCRNAHPSQLWTTYFSSSRVVKKLIARDGADAFTAEVRQVFETKDKALAWEHRFLMKVNAAGSDLWLNRFNGGRRFVCDGHKAETKRKISEALKGRKHSKAWRSKIAMKSTWAGKVSAEARARANAKLTGVPRSVEFLRKMKKTATGRRIQVQPDGRRIWVYPHELQ